MADLGTATSEKAAPTTGGLAGRTVISGRAVASVARRAACEVSGVVPVPRSGLRQRLTGLLPGGGGGGGGASAEVIDGSTTIELRLAVCWPQPVGSVSAEARRHVRARVEELTGYAVHGIDIVVDALPEPPDTGDRAR